MDLQKEHALETYRSLISISLAGLKTLLLVNGGAVVALLTYLEHSPQGASLASHDHVPFPMGATPAKAGSARRMLAQVVCGM